MTLDGRQTFYLNNFWKVAKISFFPHCFQFENRYDPTIENTHRKIIKFRKVNFATDIVDTAGMVRLRERHHKGRLFRLS